MPKSVSLFCPSDPIPKPVFACRRRLILKPERVLRPVLSSSPYFGVRQDGVALSTLLSTGCVILLSTGYVTCYSKLSCVLQIHLCKMGHCNLHLQVYFEMIRVRHLAQPLRDFQGLDKYGSYNLFNIPFTGIPGHQECEGKDLESRYIQGCSLIHILYYIDLSFILKAVDTCHGTCGENSRQLSRVNPLLP